MCFVPHFLYHHLRLHRPCFLHALSEIMLGVNRGVIVNKHEAYLEPTCTLLMSLRGPNLPTFFPYVGMAHDS